MAAGLVNAAHQLGGSLGVGVLVAVAAGVAGGGESVALARVASAGLTTGALLLALALIVASVFVVRGNRGRAGAVIPPASEPVVELVGARR